MKNVLKKIMSSGLWLQPIIFLMIVKYIHDSNPKAFENSDTWLMAFIGSLVPIMLFYANSIGKPKEEDAMQGKQKAMYPPINEALLQTTPIGIILGQDKKSKKYVCKKLDEDGHVFLIGGSGSGKSSCHVIPSLLSNPEAQIFAVDIKGELSFKSTKYGNEHALIFNPNDRSQYGYEPFYSLSEKSSTQEILDVMLNISSSLIPMPANLNDPFWKQSSRNLLTGLFMYYYKSGITEFVSIIDEILSKPTRESIDEVMNNANPNSVEYRYIVQFSNMEDETLGGITSEVNNHIVIFANDQDIRYAFKDNGCKVNPMKLEEGYSIYLSIREEKLSAYYDVMQLIINQTLAQLEKRPEDSEPIIFIIDELPRILSAGKLDRLLDGARTLRSRKVCLFLITQSTEALMSAFTENEVADLISNCPYVIVLSATSSKTQKSVCSWCGKYMVRKQSWNGSGNDRKTTISYEEKDIVDPAELITLKNTGEAILITPFGYCRVEKVPYYKDKILKPISEDIVNHNKTIKNLKEKGEVKNEEQEEEQQ